MRVFIWLYSAYAAEVVITQFQEDQCNFDIRFCMKLYLRFHLLRPPLITNAKPQTSIFVALVDRSFNITQTLSCMLSFASLILIHSFFLSRLNALQNTTLNVVTT